MKTDLSTLDLTSAREALDRGELSAPELTEACLDRIERLNPRLNAFITVTAETARRQAASLPKRGRTGSLHGIPIGVKDLFETAGIRTTAGSAFFRDYVPEADAVVLRRLTESGAVVVGKTNTHEIALGVTTVNPHFGACRNPWDANRIAGGSSGGSAAAVAAGMCLGALGTDTGGSIRIPASLCGVVGLKPTFGRVSKRGVIPLSWNLDHVGPLARTVRDAAILLGAMAGYDPGDPTSLNLPMDDFLVHLDDGVRGWRVAVAGGQFIESADPEVLTLVDRASQAFRGLKAKIEEVEMNWLEAAARANGQLTQSDAAAFHRERLAAHPEWFGEDVRQRLEAGRSMTAVEYSLARLAQSEMRRRMDDFFADYDILLLPATPSAAALIEGTDAVEQARRLTRFTAPFNLTGLPALSLPCGFTSTGLPVGLQIVSAPWKEARLLQAAWAYEQSTDWHTKRPDL